MNSYRILLIDDEEDLVEMLSFRLRALGFEMLTATTGKFGIKIAQEKTPDLILVDMMMPDVDGREVCRQLKDDIKTSKIPIIVFTALSRPDLCSIVKDAGALDCITKPFEPDHLIQKINKVLEDIDARKKEDTDC